MARKPRIEFPGAFYHVISRGNQRRKTFLTPQDYEDYLARLWAYHKKFGFKLYAYCLMPNHLHLLIETGKIPLSKIMQAVQFSYTQSFNRRHRKIGHLFQGRYKAILCEKDAYLLQLIRYIHLNPVRAKIVRNPKDYRWSSHRTILGLEKCQRCDVNAVLSFFGKKRRTAVSQYEDFVLDAIGLGHQKEYYDLKDQRVLGDDEFANDMLSRDDAAEDTFYYDVSIPEIVNVVAKELDIPPSLICSPRRDRRGSFGRAIAAYLAKTVAGIPMKRVGKSFSKGEAAMAHRYRAIEKMLEKDKNLRDKIQKLRDIITGNKQRRFK